MTELFKVGLGDNAEVSLSDAGSSAEEIASRIDALGGTARLIWPTIDRESIYVVVDHSHVGGGVGEAVADSLGGELQAVEVGDVIDDDLMVTPSRHSVVGPSWRKILMAVPPDVIKCPNCPADLTKDGHSPGCPWKR